MSRTVTSADEGRPPGNEDGHPAEGNPAGDSPRTEGRTPDKARPETDQPDSGSVAVIQVWTVPDHVPFFLDIVPVLEHFREGKRVEENTIYHIPTAGPIIFLDPDLKERRSRMLQLC